LEDNKFRHFLLCYIFQSITNTLIVALIHLSAIFKITSNSYKLGKFFVRIQVEEAMRWSLKRKKMKKSLSTLIPPQSYAFTFCTVSLVVGTALLAPSGYTQPEPARSADDFVDSIGVNTHLFYDDSVYYQKQGERILI